MTEILQGMQLQRIINRIRKEAMNGRHSINEDYRGVRYTLNRLGFVTNRIENPDATARYMIEWHTPTAVDNEYAHLIGFTAVAAKNQADNVPTIATILERLNKEGEIIQSNVLLSDIRELRNRRFRVFISDGIECGTDRRDVFITHKT